jgi:hypothetical protein
MTIKFTFSSTQSEDSIIAFAKSSGYQSEMNQEVFSTRDSVDENGVKTTVTYHSGWEMIQNPQNATDFVSNIFKDLIVSRMAQFALNDLRNKSQASVAAETQAILGQVSDELVVTSEVIADPVK